MIKRILIFTIPVVFFSCDKLYNGIVKDLEVPSKDPILTCQLFVDAKDTLIKAIVGQSYGILDSVNSGINDVFLSLYKSDTLLASWQTQSSSSSMVYPISLSMPLSNGTAGVVYRLECSHAGLNEQLVGEQVVPSKAIVEDLNSSYTIDTDDGYRGLLVNYSFRLKDIPGENQYYLLTGKIKYLDSSTNDTIEAEIENWTTSNLAERPSNSLKALLLTEDRIDQDINVLCSGRYYDFPYNVDPSVVIETTLSIKTLTSDYFQFIESYTTYQNTFTNPFAEPSRLHSNMVEGIGCFGLSNSIEVTI